MQRAIGLVWPNSSHRLCIWHIEQNIVRNLHDDDVKADFRYFLYDCCSIEEIEHIQPRVRDDYMLSFLDIRFKIFFQIYY